jgi:hypothetical protein
VKCPNTSCGRAMRIVQHKQWKDIYYWRCDNCRGRVFDSFETVKTITDRMQGRANDRSFTAREAFEKTNLFDGIENA